MATIKDVAAQARVSITSVSNYLNNRPGISEETARRIESAIDSLHYVVRNAARDLRSTKNREIGIIFPSISEPYLEKLINSIKGYLMLNNRDFFLELTNSEPAAESRAVINAIGRRVDGLVLYTCQPENKGMFQQLAASEIPFVMIDRKPTDVDCNFVGCDNDDLFYRLTEQAVRLGIRRIALVTGSADYEENRNAVTGAERALAGLAGNVALQTVYTTPIRECGLKAGVHLMDEGSAPPELILTNSYLLAEGLRYAMQIYHLDPRRDVQIICTGDCIRDVFYNDDTIQKTSRPTFEIGERAAQMLLANIKSPVIFDKERILLKDSVQDAMLRAPSHGAAIAGSIPDRFRDKITVLLIDEHTSVDSLSQLLVDFYHKENIAVEIRKIRPQEQFRYIEDYVRSGGDDIDVFLFDIPWLPYFADRGYLMCLDPFLQEYQMDFAHLIPGIMPIFGQYDDKLYALPYLACVQMLFYRRDLFQNEVLRREFERMNMLPLRPPKNWLQYNAIARFFTREYNANSPTKYGHSMTLSYPENMFCDLMPKIWGYGGSLLDQKRQINLNTPQVHKAIRSMAEGALYSSPRLTENFPIDTVKDFCKGDCCMVYTYNYFAISIVDKLKSVVHNDYAFAPLPGRSVLSGWSLGIARNSHHADAAFRFLRWASAADIAVPQTILGGQSPNVSVYRNYDMVSLYPWLPLALKEFGNSGQRLTPIHADGRLMNEWDMEHVIFEKLFPYIKETLSKKTVNERALAQILNELQEELRSV